MRRACEGARWLRAISFLAVLANSCALFGLDALGGTYRYGHIFWDSEGNTVHITVETAFRRNVGTTYFQGSAPDGFAQVGDIVTLTGRETPKIYLGDSTIVDVLRMKVTAYSVVEDWIMGEIHVTHKYATPSDRGLPWEVQYTGCCRLSNLQNNKDQEWVLTAKVDLTRAKASARARILPVISVPYADTVSVMIPATTPSNEEVVRWSMEQPFDVGNAAGFSASLGSMITVPLQPVYQNSTWGFSHPCVLVPTVDPPCGYTLASRSVGPATLFRLLRTDNMYLALTLEGWVKSSTDEGGVFLSTGRDDSPSAPSECVGSTGLDRGMCDVSTIMVRVNATHVTVGHEVWDGSQFVLNTVAFSVCSNQDLCADLQDTQKYPLLAFQQATPTTTNKWIHVAVVRKSKLLLQTPEANWYSTYMVYVNGFPLELATFPGCSPDTMPNSAEDISEVTCRGRKWKFTGYGSIFSAGESNPVVGPRRSPTETATTNSKDGQCKIDRTPSCEDLFATRTALVFGSFRGASASTSTRTFFSGSLDEWRFWNGVRSRTEILELMQRPLIPRLEESYGDPTRAQDQNGANIEITTSNYLSSSVLMADYNFDKMVGGVVPIYPKLDDRLPPASKMDPQVYRGIAFNVDNVDTDDTGVMFHSDVRNANVDTQGRLTISKKPDVAGLYQMSLLLSMPQNASVVPVDFILRVTDSAGDNAYMPELTVAPASVQLYPAATRIYQGFEFNMTLMGQDLQTRISQPQGCSLGQNGCRMVFDTQIGFTMGPMPASARFSSVRGMNPGSMMMKWTPCTNNLGVSTLCFDAVDNHINLTSGSSLPSKASEMKCVKLQVVPDPSPSLELVPGETLQLTMGRETLLQASAADDNCQDSVRIQVQYGVLLPETDTIGKGVGCNGVVRTMMFKPSYKMGGYKEDICVSAVDSGGSCPGAIVKPPVRKCVTVVVARCRYALQMDQQLQDLAAQFGMDWIRLWSLNGDLLHPDNIVYSGQEINVGHKYKVAPNDRLEDIAKRMGMPIQQLLDLNYGLDAGGEVLMAGTQELCVVPNSCMGMKRTVYSDLAYRDGKFFAQQMGDMSGAALP